MLAVVVSATATAHTLRRCTLTFALRETGGREEKDVIGKQA